MTLRFLLVATVAFAVEWFAHEAIDRPTEIEAAPYAPSAAAAPFVSLGYREVAADVLWVRFQGYFGGPDTVADALSDLVEAIVALDPHFKPAYTHGPSAMALAEHGTTQATYHRELAVLERGMQEFPDDWKLPSLAAQVYTQDFRTTDPAERRRWDEKGLLLMESAIRKPGAPPDAITSSWVATMRSKLGEHERAVEGLREMLRLTRDTDARKKLLAKLAKLEDLDDASADQIGAEIFETQRKFLAAWMHDRPALNQTFYVLLGPRPASTFDMTDLATGGRDLVEDGFERLEPVTDAPPDAPDR